MTVHSFYSVKEEAFHMLERKGRDKLLTHSSQIPLDAFMF